MDLRSPVVVSGHGGVILNPFLAFLERLSLEIQEDQFGALKFLLQGKIPLGILEKCQKPRELFNCMMQTSLLGENNLDNLELLFEEVRRSDLAERVRVFKQSSVEVDCALPAAMETVCFAIGAQKTDLNVKAAEEKLKLGMCGALNTVPSEMPLVGSEEVGDNWFNLIFQIPKRKEVLDKLRWEAIEKKAWLSLCGVKAVMIGNESQILLQPVTRSLSLTLTADTACCHNDKKLDLILVVDCAISNPAVLGLLKTQLCHLVKTIFSKGFHLRLALISYRNHQKTSRFGMRSTNPLINNTVFTENFTDDKKEMKDCISTLRCFGKTGTTKGLADGLASALHLSKAGRRDAIKLCILLPMMDRRATLEIFKCEHGYDVMKLCRQLSLNSVTLYTVAVAMSQPVSSYLPDPAPTLMADFFTGISLRTGGQFIQIQNIKLISEVLMYIIDEDVTMERLFGTAYDIIFEEIKKQENGNVDLEHLTNVLEGALNQRFCRVSLILLDRLTIGPKSQLAKMFSLDEDINSACTTFQCALEKLRQSNIVTKPGTPSDVNMEMEETETLSPQVSLSTHHRITTNVSERMVRKVGLRKTHYR